MLIVDRLRQFGQTKKLTESDTVRSFYVRSIYCPNRTGLLCSRIPAPTSRFCEWSKVGPVGSGRATFSESSHGSAFLSSRKRGTLP
jgi:hypothetical protein